MVELGERIVRWLVLRWNELAPLNQPQTSRLRFHDGMRQAQVWDERRRRQRQPSLRRRCVAAGKPFLSKTE